MNEFEDAPGTLDADDLNGDLDALTIDLFDAASGAIVGRIGESDLRVLQDHLEEESDSDDDYYINETTIDLMESAGATPRLLDALRAVLVDGEGDVRWERDS